MQHVDFPILFKICLSDNDSSKYRALGYKNVHKFFRGQSKHNSSLIGWSGHTEDGKIISTPTGKTPKTVWMFKENKIFVNPVSYVLNF